MQPNYNIQDICSVIKADWKVNRNNTINSIKKIYKDSGQDIFLDKDDQEYYLSAIYSIVKTIRPEQVIQTGTFIGGTLVSMIAAFKENNIDGFIDTIDPEPPFYGDGIVKNPVNVAKMVVQRNSFSERINFLKGYSVKAWDKDRIELTNVPEGVLIRLAKNQYADFLIIDGDHTYEGTFWDLEIGSRALKPGGARFIFVHDYASIPDVRNAIKTWKKIHKDKILFRANNERNGFALIQCLPEFFVK